MSLERTLALIKPDAVQSAPELQQLAELAGFTVVAKQELQVRQNAAFNCFICEGHLHRLHHLNKSAPNHVLLHCCATWQPGLLMAPGYSLQFLEPLHYPCMPLCR